MLAAVERHARLMHNIFKKTDICTKPIQCLYQYFSNMKDVLGCFLSFIHFICCSEYSYDL